jgi:hypothetical protein
MKATELLANQMEMVHARITGLAGMTRQEWLARPAAGENRAGFTAWHIAATRDWAVRAIFQTKPPLGWGAPFAGTAIARCEIPFGMRAEEADAIAEATTPGEVIAYSRAVTDELVRWIGSLDDEVLAFPTSDGRGHLSLSQRYGEKAYREETENSAVPMYDWPTWTLLVRPCFAHSLGHLAEIGLARKALHD